MTDWKLTDPSSFLIILRDLVGHFEVVYFQSPEHVNWKAGTDGLMAKRDFYT